MFRGTDKHTRYGVRFERSTHLPTAKARAQLAGSVRQGCQTCPTSEVFFNGRPLPATSDVLLWP
ncbi:MAG: hypothetical protein ACM3PY_19430 [Omnitrophica WOR_2 bacterium]